MLRGRLRELARKALVQLARTDGVPAAASRWASAMPAAPATAARLGARSPAWDALNRRAFASAAGGDGGDSSGSESDSDGDDDDDEAAAAGGGDASSSAGGGDAAAAAPRSAADDDESAAGVRAADGAAAASDAPPGDANAALAAWGAAMDAGDWERAWEVFEGSFPVDAPEFPPLEELINWDPEAEDKAGRRERERGLQEAVAAARTRRVDAEGRAHGVGRRKAAVARVWLREGPGHVMVNRRPFDQHFTTFVRRADVLAPFEVTGLLGRFDVMVAVAGGGQTGQAQAVRHGAARALQAWDPALRPALKAAGLLTRDARVVERKKPGRKKARKSFQWVKR